MGLKFHCRQFQLTELNKAGRALAKPEIYNFCFLQCCWFLNPIAAKILLIKPIRFSKPYRFEKDCSE